ncbi:MAG: hydrolase [Oscillospiraceae bacterium]
MSYVPTLAQARELMEEFNAEEFHRRHAEIVSGVMGFFAREFDPENEEYWAVVGMLHDLDFERYPDEHCVKEIEIMRGRDIDESVIRACACHGYGLVPVEFAPERKMEKVLFAIDELTGLIGAVAMIRPSKSVDDLEVKSVMKKFKQPTFAAGCSRDVIAQGAEGLEMTTEELADRTIAAMRSLNPRLGI